VKNWKYRWFVLDEDHISYYEKKEDNVPKGTIPLLGASVEKLKEDKKERKYFFSIATSGQRVFQIFAFTEEDRSYWIEHVRAAIEIAREPSVTSIATKKIKKGILTMAPVGTSVWIGCMEPVMHIWDSLTNQREELLLKLGLYSPDNPLVNKAIKHRTRSGALQVWASIDRALVRFDAQSPKQLDCWVEHVNPITAMAETLGDEPRVLSASRDHILVWESESGRLLRTLEIDMPLVYALLPIGVFVWACGYDSKNVEVLRIFSSDFQVLRELNEAKHHTEAISSLVVSRFDSCWSASKDSVICIWR